MRGRVGDGGCVGTYTALRYTTLLRCVLKYIKHLALPCLNLPPIYCLEKGGKARTEGGCWVGRFGSE